MTISKRLVKVGDTVTLKSSERKFSKLSYGEQYKVEGIEPNNGYWDGSSYITVLSDKNNFVFQLRMYESFFDIVSATEGSSKGEDMVGRKFKCKDHDTLYEIIDLKEDYYTIQWHKSDGELDSVRNTVASVEDAFDKGGWYFVDKPFNPTLDEIFNYPFPDTITPHDIDPPKKTTSDAVNHPKHYTVFEQLEAIEVIASSMTTEQFYGYCLGNILKYRLRAGGKDDVMQELGKADRYQGLFKEYKHLCKDAK